MKTLLLLLVALVLSAQGIDPTVHRSPFVHPYMPDEYFTLHQLNGHWWENASEVERKIYLLAWQDTTGENIRVDVGIYRFKRLDLNLPVKDMLKTITPRRRYTF